jgi:hypothetical protein
MNRVVLGLAGALSAVGLVLAPAGGSAPSHACVNSNELWFRAADGTRLVGHRFGGAKPGARTAVVMAHMSVGDLCQWVPFARRLARQRAFASRSTFAATGSPKVARTTDGPRPTSPRQCGRFVRSGRRRSS